MNKNQLNLIGKIFEGIPSQKILNFAKDIQARLKTELNLALEKENGEWVTAADIWIQKCIIKYFSKSLLTNTFVIKAEEEMKKRKITDNEFWQLLVDPLDGTSSFRRCEQTWGVMIGSCDKEGILRYSWNLLSTGDVYKTNSSSPFNRDSFQEKTEKGELIRIDVYNYGNNISDRFGGVFEEMFDISPGQYEQTSYQAAVWTGWQLYQGNLDGLLWLPSDKGKKWYPDYDLIFLGALWQNGFKIRLGKIGDKNALIAIASRDKDVEKLYEVGLRLVIENQRKNIFLSTNPLQITNNI